MRQMMSKVFQFFLAISGGGFIVSFLPGLLHPALGLLLSAVITVICLIYVLIKHSSVTSILKSWRKRAPGLILICQTFGSYWLFFLLFILILMMLAACGINIDKFDKSISSVISTTFGCLLMVVIGEIVLILWRKKTRALWPRSRRL